MSSDLLAEFDSFYKSPKSSTTTKAASSNTPQQSNSNGFSFFDPPNISNLPQTTQSQWSTTAQKQDNDIWGDFNALQIGSSTQASVPTNDSWGNFEVPARSVPVASAYPNNGTSSLDFGGKTTTKQQSQPQPSRDRSTTLDLFSSNYISSATSHQASPPQHSSYHIPFKPQEPKTNPGDVLFDADEEFGDDDDFGDFETVAAPAPAPSVAPTMNLLSIDSPPKPIKAQKRPEPLATKSSTLIANPFPYPQAPKSPSFKERNPFGGIALKTPTNTQDKSFEDALKTRDSPVTAWPSYVPTIPKPDLYQDSPAANDSLDDDWGDFTDLPPNPAPAKPTTGIEADAWAWDSADNVQPVAATEPNIAPPTNIPPPSVLLALFSQLFNLPQTALFKPVSMQTHSIKSRILADPTTITFLRSYIALSTVCSHIIAGRKLRWKRDTILAQAMKIGPSAAGGKGGMKLTGVDKAEITREEREVVDVVRVWQEQVGRLRSAVAAANASLQIQSELLVVPEIGEQMMAKAEGGLNAPKPCVLCGLKREERVAKVDVKVEDSFGEWWIDHWGHRTCRNFWQEHEGKLRGR